MRIRVVEWSASRGERGAKIAEAQWTDGHPWAVLGDLGVGAEDKRVLRDEVPADVDFTDRGGSSVRIVFHHAEGEPISAVESLVREVFPRMDKPNAVASALVDPHDGSHYLVTAGNNRFVAPTRVRLTVPSSPSEDGSVHWTSGSILMLEQALFVAWLLGPSDDANPASRIDTVTRGGQYGQHPPIPLTELGTGYIEATLAAIKRITVECRRLLDTWESQFVATYDTTSRSRPVDMTVIRNLRSTAAQSLFEIDGLRRRLRNAGSWSTDPLTPIDRTVINQAFEGAEVAVEQLRRDITDVLNLVNTVRIGQQLAATQEAADRTEALQSSIALATALFLVPALIGTVFGANIALPGGDESGRAIVMYATMAVGALLTYFAVQKWGPNKRR